MHVCMQLPRAGINNAFDVQPSVQPTKEASYKDKSTLQPSQEESGEEIRRLTIFMPRLIYVKRAFIFWKAFSMGLVPSIWGIREYIALNTKILPASWDSDNLQKKRAARNPIIAPQAQLLAPQTLSVCQRWQDTLIVS